MNIESLFLVRLHLQMQTNDPISLDKMHRKNGVYMTRQPFSLAYYKTSFFMTKHVIAIFLKNSIIDLEK